MTDIRRFRPAGVSGIGHDLDAERGRVVAALEVLLRRRAVGVSWSGAASASAADRYGWIVVRLQDVAARIGVTTAAVVRAAARMQAALDLVRRAERRAEREGAWVDFDGRLVLPARPTSGDTVLLAVRARADELLALEVRRTLLEAEREADATDVELARVIVAAARAAVDPGVVGLRALPPPPASPTWWSPGPTGSGTELPVPACSSSGSWPAAVCPDAQPSVDLPFASAAWWRGLIAEERAWAIREHPQWVGPRDGLPARARHAANLALLAEAERAASVRLRQAIAEATPWNATERTEAQERVDDLRAIRDVLARRDGVERSLLLVDARGRNVKAIVALGDVDGAQHVATFVGGLSTTVRGDLGRYDTTFARMRKEAKAVAGAGDVAVVTWLGYEAPQMHEIVTARRSVLSGEVARDNADELAAFANGLDAARDRPAHQTWWAHSYGAVLAGRALLLRSGVDDVALFGSPGEPFARIEETGLKPGALNVIRAPWDLVASSGWLVHGTPATWVTGATWLAATKPAGANGWTSASGHSDYLSAGTVSEHNLVAVAAGRPDLVVRVSHAERAADPRWGDLAPLL
ncbi:alpha/beta hydrolase [Intrasporangium oryzae]|uniref:alpha/beta hydrolase n=1 Tax=Intrasporangium oryzae TaxID=412687 RepID=UPI0012FC1394|nr:alpha/beta hydrolase [Intrasporangium oryzae]